MTADKLLQACVERAGSRWKVRPYMPTRTVPDHEHGRWRIRIAPSTRRGGPLFAVCISQLNLLNVGFLAAPSPTWKYIHTYIRSAWPNLLS